ncbi:ABC transporter ATP-binding protein [Acetivibrio straminisolvens]|jgi:putative ABC transport system ATP-binding protein|uniref:Methionine ABC transporter ATP-binding protein n=1 Tax=Acetivibrio straminisolvens JCM 21531 TaxID=1294263 RepID=W4VAU3_9FIRM|nr:ABC transporter ATP-binding protein [Acetivibrio straminisolvens]GAE90317.1 methionine ABC transporter ATP-binding protein [Acetivibrio straminisolvens JCM 21531]
MEPIISITNLSKIYRVGSEKVIALQDVNMNIYKGEFCCFLGTSGSGKSTLLNVLAGLEKPTRGSIRIKNVNIEKLNEKKLAAFRQNNVGFIFQAYNLVNYLNAVENVSLPLMFKGISKKERTKRAVDLLKAVGLSKHLRHKPTQMSGGQQQRVGIARAFVTNPEIVFADEPTGNLDSKTSMEVLDLMAGLAKKNRQTLIMVTHDLNIAKRADRIVYILDGQIEKIEENQYTGVTYEQN